MKGGKAIIRIVGLTVAVALASLAPASGWNFGCYVSCPDGTYLLSASPCCGPLPQACPGGSDGYGFAYETWEGPQFCTA